MEIPLKGKRNYVRGADICRELHQKILSRRSPDDFSRLVVKFSKLTKNKVKLKISPSKIKLTDNCIASGFAKFIDETIFFNIDDIGDETRARVESSEKFIFDPIKIENNKIKICHWGVGIEAIVEKTKQLHTQLFPPGEDNSWIFVALDINRVLMPDILTDLEIEYQADRGTITESTLKNIDGKFGMIYFSSVDKSQL